MFASNNSLGIVTSINSFISKDFKITNNTIKNSSINSRANVSEISYNGNTIYEIKNLNISSIIPLNLRIINLKSFNVYAFIQNDHYVVFGNLNGVKASINNINSKNAFNTSEINSGNMTFIINFKNNTIKTIMYENSTYIYIYNLSLNKDLNLSLNKSLSAAILNLITKSVPERYINIYEKKNYTEIYIKMGFSDIIKG